jgi:hypothetical protein
MAEELGLSELVPGALINIGSARANAGDDGGIAELERAVEIALATNNPELARAYNNLAAMQSDLERAYELQLKGREAAERLGNAPVCRYLEGQIMLTVCDLGRWDEFLELAEGFLSGSLHYSAGYIHERRADIYVARDDLEAGAQESAHALELAREAKDPQALQPALRCQMSVDLARGRVEEARSVARELVSMLERSASSFGVLDLALHADVLGVRDALPAIIATRADRSWVRIAAAVLEADFLGAADIAAEHGFPAVEAELRLRAAEALVAERRRAEADVQLQKALAFYRSVGATRYIREGEALLAATA